MGDLIEFPTAQDFVEVPSENIEMTGVLPLPDTCEGILHIFDAVPGTCRCGEETWTPEGKLADPPSLDGPHVAIGLHEAG